MQKFQYKTWRNENNLIYLILKKIKLSPLMLMFFPYSCGIAIGRYFNLPKFYIIIPLVACICMIAFNFLSKHRYAKYSLYTGITIFLIIFGYSNMHFYYQQLYKKNEKLYALASTPEFKTYQLKGQVLKAPIPGGNGCKTYIAVMSRLDGNNTEEELGGKISVFIQGVDYKDLKPGDIIKFTSGLKPVRSYKTPASFDFEIWRASVGIMVSGFVKEQDKPEILENVKHSKYLPLPLYLNEITRWNILKSIDSKFSEETKGVAMGFLIGEKGWMSREQLDAFQVTGTMHLLAISGLNMGLMVIFLGGAVYFMLVRWQWLAERFMVRKIAVIIALFGGVVYTSLAGFTPSAVRAMIMMIALSIPFVLNLSQTTINSLAIAGWIMLVLYPVDLFSVSFQLSFLAVLFLIIFLGSGVESMEHKNDDDKSIKEAIKQNIIDLTKSSLVCSFALSPILAWYFQKITPLSLPINLVSVPLSNFLVVPELLLGAVFLPFSEKIAGIIWKFPEFFTKILLDIIMYAAKFPFAYFMTVRPCIYQVFFAYLIIILMVYVYMAKKKFWLSVIIGSLLVSPINQTYYNPFEKPGLKIYTLDVGQGNCHVLRLPGNKLMVINAGGAHSESFDIGERVIAPFIRSIGHKKIDILAFSNPDKDNTGGMSALVTMFEVGEIWSNGETSSKDYFTEFMEIARKKNIPHKIIKKDDVIFMDEGLILKVLTSESCKECYNEASRSLVFFINHREKKMLFSGDIDRKREQYITKENLGKIHVITVPNFGATISSSDEFVSSVTPDIGVISVGWRNFYGFPKEETLKKYENAKTRIFRTDYNGTMTIRINAGDLFYKPYQGKEEKL